MTGVRGDKQELLSSTVRRISTKDIVGSFHDSSVALEVSVNVHPPEVLVLIAFPLKPILFFFSFRTSCQFFVKALSEILCIHLVTCHK